MSLTSAPRTRIGAITRHLTGVGVRTPEAGPGTDQHPMPPRKRSDMTVAIPAVTFPGPGTGRDITGHPPAPGLLLIMSGPAARRTGPGRQPAPPRWSGDRSGLWLRNAAVGLCVLAAAAAAVSFTAQYRMVEATRHLPAVAALEAAIPDAAALVFACLGIALAAARPPRAARPGAEPGLGRRQRVHERHRGRSRLAEPGHLGHAARSPTPWPATPSSPSSAPATSSWPPPWPTRRPPRWPSSAA